MNTDKAIITELTDAAIDILPYRISHTPCYKHKIPATKLLKLKRIVKKVCDDRS